MTSKSISDRNGEIICMKIDINTLADFGYCV